MKVILILFWLLTFASCATHDSHEFKLKANHQLNISTVLGNERRDTIVKEGEIFSLPEGISTLEADHKLPLMIITENEKMARNAEGSAWEVNLKSVDEWRPQDTEVFITKEMDNLYISLIDVLMMAKSKKISESLKLATEISKKYPRLSSVHFIKAQLEFIERQRENAIASLDICLELNPQFVEAKNFKARIMAKGNQ